MAKKASLRDIHILLAETDANLGILLSQVLQRMGFRKVHLVREARAALEYLDAYQVDIFITEWQLPDLDGIELTKHIRKSEKTPNRVLPIIMVTARAERQDVEMARDVGITEFIVKPYNSMTIYRRIQQVVDNPRAFMLAPEYVGPDRRRRVIKLEKQERRTQEPELIARVPETAHVANPKLVLPDFAIKRKIGPIESLDQIISASIIKQAQVDIDSLKDKSMEWIRDYVGSMNECYRLIEKEFSPERAEKLEEVLLKVKANAGTFGYTGVFKLSQQLYQFMRVGADLTNANHLQVVNKHVQSITVLLSESAAGRVHEKESWLIHALKTMVQKFRT